MSNWPSRLDLSRFSVVAYRGRMAGVQRGLVVPCPVTSSLAAALPSKAGHNNKPPRRLAALGAAVPPLRAFQDQSNMGERVSIPRPASLRLSHNLNEKWHI